MAPSHRRTAANLTGLASHAVGLMGWGNNSNSGTLRGRSLGGLLYVIDCDRKLKFCMNADQVGF
jgi:hypothetical protein